MKMGPGTSTLRNRRFWRFLVLIPRSESAGTFARRQTLELMFTEIVSACRQWQGVSHLQPHNPHQLDGIALRHHSLAQPVIEFHLSLLHLIFKVYVLHHGAN